MGTKRYIILFLYVSVICVFAGSDVRADTVIPYELNSGWTYEEGYPGTLELTENPTGGIIVDIDIPTGIEDGGLVASRHDLPDYSLHDHGFIQLEYSSFFSGVTGNSQGPDMCLEIQFRDAEELNYEMAIAVSQSTGGFYFETWFGSEPDSTYHQTPVPDGLSLAEGALGLYSNGSIVRPYFMDADGSVFYPFDASIDPWDVSGITGTQEYSVDNDLEGTTTAGGTIIASVNLEQVVYGPGTPPAPPAEDPIEVEIPDPGLEAAIREALGIGPEDQITDTGLAELISLTANYKSISDLTGLEYCVNLESLILRMNDISDIGALSGLTSLEYLDLSGNDLSDIGALSGLPNLEHLDLSWNNIIEIGPLSGLINLEWLSLSGNNYLSNIGALSGLTNLTWLSLYTNNISDISALSGLTNLEYLDLRENNLSDIGALSGLTNLTTLHLSYNPYLSDIGALSGLTNLEYLEVSGNNNLSDIGALSGLTNLEYLDLGWCNISDIKPLVNNTGLDTGDNVYLMSNPLSYGAINTDIPVLLARGVLVYYDDRTPTTLFMVSGDGQTAEPSSTLPESFVVQVWDQNTDPFEGVPVIFSVVEGGGSLVVETTTTNIDGFAESILILGPSPGINTVEVSAAEIATVVIFEAIAEIELNQPAEQIEEILNFIDECVEDGTLIGEGPGKSADNRLNALINKLEEARRLIEAGSLGEACDQLWSTYRKCDGQLRPPDFVAGEAAEDLADMILWLMDELGC